MMPNEVALLVCWKTQDGKGKTSHTEADGKQPDQPGRWSGQALPEGRREVEYERLPAITA